MIRPIATFAAFTLFAGPALAESHLSDLASIGEANFKFCQSCHVVHDDEGNVLAGRKAKSGPNLYGIVGRTAGGLEGYKFGTSIAKAGEAGLVWDEEQLIAYLLDPKKYLQTYLEDSSARSKMSFKMRADKKNGLTAEESAAAMYAFLAEIGPEMTAEVGEETDPEAESEGAADTDATN